MATLRSAPPATITSITTIAATTAANSGTIDFELFILGVDTLMPPAWRRRVAILYVDRFKSASFCSRNPRGFNAMIENRHMRFATHDTPIYRVVVNDGGMPKFRTHMRIAAEMTAYGFPHVAHCGKTEMRKTKAKIEARFHTPSMKEEISATCVIDRARRQWSPAAIIAA